MISNSNSQYRDLNQLSSLSEQERAIAISILNQYADSGKSNLYDDILYEDFDEIPVTIDEFLHNRKYLGNALYDNDNRFTLFPYWENKLKEIFPTNTTTAYNTIIFTGAIGLGKAQPLYSKVLTQSGYKKMGDLILSDKVYGRDGKLHRIIGIFPQGKRKTYRVSFKDGTYTDAADSHLWTIYDKRYGYRKETLTTEEILNKKPLYKINKFGYKERILSIPLCEPIEFEAKNHINQMTSTGTYSLHIFFRPVFWNRKKMMMPRASQTMVMIIPFLAKRVNIKIRPAMAMIGTTG